ncbi:PGAP1-domain-containing protein [Conidiobolus coronatus NRRL 28638]|uniref:GPI inositol-deacylase n=1 Tax=Conidiobolus coronatus (strain ATCC 28846 / CBS 209.66 / NRRL 28638) TaxID=796925 RepID=A0A137P7E1_CONC2|nr:PGAP1-domain-containing protein [Conidiobolus coronatus NRRL 28638]|eukprot:KXN70918.1 PGAP1-domain-containing protein [Conidiobolus coronatus NRRL 28638]
MNLSKVYYIIFSIVSIGLIVFSNIYQKNNYEISKCRMTYMYPSFYPIDVPSVPKVLQRYKLYLYRDGRFDSEEKLNGTPLLFIPGNRGSYGQARSLGGVLQEIAFERGQTEKRYDIFSADLNEEFTAFSTQSLEDQAKFINHCIQTILDLYRSTQLNPKPESVVIVAHSMGGVVIKRSAMLPNYLPGSVNTIITLATPHEISRVPFDSSMIRLYQEVNSFWKYSRYTSISPITDTILINISGGVQDLLISDRFAQMESGIEWKGMHLFSSQVQNTWTSTDHLCILWCNQLVIQLANALTDIHRPHFRGRTILNSFDRIRAINSTLLYENVADITPSNSFHTPILDMNFSFKKQQMPKELRLKATKPIALTSNHKFKIFTCKEAHDCNVLHTSKLMAIPATNDKEFYGVSNYFTMNIPKLENGEQDLILVSDSLPQEDSFLYSRELPEKLPSFEFSLLDLIIGANLTLDDNFHTQTLIKLPYSSFFTYSIKFSQPDIILRLHSNQIQETKFIVRESHALLKPFISYTKSMRSLFFENSMIIEADFWNTSYQTSGRSSISIKLNWLHTLGSLGSIYEMGIMYFPILLLTLVHLRQVQILNRINIYYDLEQVLKRILKRSSILHTAIFFISLSQFFIPVQIFFIPIQGFVQVIEAFNSIQGFFRITGIFTLSGKMWYSPSIHPNYWMPFYCLYSILTPHLLFIIGIGLTWILYWVSTLAKFILKLVLYPFHLLLKSKIIQIVNSVLIIVLLIAGFSPQLLTFIMYLLAFTSTISNENHSKLFEPIRTVILFTILVLTPSATTNIWNLVKMGEIWSESGFDSITNTLFLVAYNTF